MSVTKHIICKPNVYRTLCKKGKREELFNQIQWGIILNQIRIKYQNYIKNTYDLDQYQYIPIYLLYCA
jgi:hypothetical protein